MPKKRVLPLKKVKYQTNILALMVAKNHRLETPPNKMGVKSTPIHLLKPSQSLEFRLDWIQGTFHTQHFHFVSKIVSRLLGGDEFKCTPRGTKCFAVKYEHPTGAVMAIGHRNFFGTQVNNKLSYLEIKGTPLRPVSMFSVYKLFKSLHKMTDFKMTRQDNACDDYGKNLDFDLISSLKDKKHYTGFRNGVEEKSRGRGGSRGREVIFGNRGKQGSGKRVNFYDKSKESKGKIDCHRIELSLSQQYAHECFVQLATTPFNQWSDVFKGWLSGAIDFIHRRGKNDKNPKRRARYKWWDYYVGNAAKYKPSRTYKVKSLETIKQWWFGQIAPSLAVLLRCLGKEDMQKFWQFFWEVADDGTSRLREKHLRIIDTS